MAKNRQNTVQGVKRSKTGAKRGAETAVVRRDSLTRTKQILNAALRVWELKQRIRAENASSLS